MSESDMMVVMATDFSAVDLRKIVKFPHIVCLNTNSDSVVFKGKRKEILYISTVLITQLGQKIYIFQYHIMLFTQEYSSILTIIEYYYAT